MAIQLKQNLKQTQTLKMTPQLQQAIALLQLSHLELEQYIAKEMQENPVLELGHRKTLEEDTLSRQGKELTAESYTHLGAKEITDLIGTSKKNELDKIDFNQNSFNNDEDLSLGGNTHFENSSLKSSKSSSKGEGEAIGFENFTAKKTNLSDHLWSQISELGFSHDERNIAEVLIGNLDERGYLDIAIEVVAEELQTTPEAVEDVLDCLQRLEPAGIFARDIKECYLIQIRENKLKNGVIEKIVKNHFNDLMQRNFNSIAKALGVTTAVVTQNLKTLAHLPTHPASKFENNEQQIYVVPDVYVYKIGGEWVIKINDDGIPPLAINEGYANMAKKKGENKDTSPVQYLQDKLRNAQWLLRSLHQRQRTILRVAECILKKQIDFFERGVDYLRPMILKDIAEDVELHESTISRVTTNKYIHTPRGVFEFKYFFNSSVSTSDGSGIASESVKSKIAELVKSESDIKPYSDQQIVEMLKKTGIDVARRTVAKYREQLGILPSSQRRKLFRLEA